MGTKAKGKAAPTVVNLRFHNEGTHMAAAHHGAKGKDGKPKRRRRRNPTFGQAVLKTLGGAATAAGTSVVELIALAHLPAHPLVMYGVPVVVAGIGAGVATKYPTVGVGMAAGALLPLSIPVASAMLGAGTAALSTKGMAALRAHAAADRSYARLGAVRTVNGVTMGAVRTYG